MRPVRPVAFGTVQHMLFDNAKLEAGRDHSGAGRRLGHRHHRDQDGEGDRRDRVHHGRRRREDREGQGARRRPRHQLSHRPLRKRGAQATAKKGVDVAFEHVGPDTFNGSLLCLKRGGRLVTCGSTSGQSTQINLFQLYLQQYRIFGSFGCTIRNVHESLAKMAAGLTPVIDTEVPLAEFESGLARLEGRKVFGKIIVTF